MAIQTKVGRFTIPAATSATNIAVPAACPFEPLALELWTGGNTALDADNTGAYGLQFSKGIVGAAGGSDEYCVAAIGSRGELFGAVNDGSAFFSKALYFLKFDIFGIGIEASLSLVSYDNAGGGFWNFTVFHGGTAAQARVVYYKAYGGLSNVNVIRKDDTAGNPLTGVGFCSDLVKCIGSTTSSPTIEGTANSAPFSVGCFNHSGEQWARNLFMTGGFGATSGGDRTHFEDAYLCWGSHDAARYRKLRFDSMTSDGWAFTSTETGSAPLGSPGGSAFLCMKGVSSRIISIAKRTSTGVQNIALPINPIDVEIVGIHVAASADGGDHARMAIGAADSTGGMGTVAVQYTSGLAAGTAHAGGISSDVAFLKLDNNTATVEASATATLGTATADLNWTVNDADDDEIGVCAVAASGDYGTCLETQTIELSASISAPGAPGFVVSADVTGLDIAESISLSAGPATFELEDFLITVAAPADEEEGTSADLGSADALLLYDTFLKAWSVWPDVDCTALWIVRDATTGVEEVFSGGRNGQVLVLNRPGAVNTYTAIASHTSALGEQGSEKSPRYLFMYFKEQGSQTVTVETFFDFSATATQTLTVTLVGLSSALLGTTFILGTSVLGSQTGQVAKRLDLRGTGEFLTIRVRNGTAGQLFTWLGYEVLWRPRRIVRRG